MTSHESSVSLDRQALRQTVINFIGRIAQRREVCRQVQALTARQQPLIDADDYAGIYEILTAKQQLLDRLQQDTAVGSDLKSQYHGFREQLDDATNTAVNNLLDDLQTAIQQVILDEEACRQSLAEKRDATCQELKDLSRGRRAHQNHRASFGPPKSRRLDIKT